MNKQELTQIANEAMTDCMNTLIGISDSFLSNKINYGQYSQRLNEWYAGMIETINADDDLDYYLTLLIESVDRSIAGENTDAMISVFSTRLNNYVKKTYLNR